ncbi:KdsC family phosphatase [Caminibacter pacificus]|uniref:3-deoxy-D-manno-octulosonate 8-phosphate phosphatase (KDO 8-P phosphatase) n=1 Tax=Caminibacter pacificus TaxID=1424653 RepID=A0AAJ4REF8_9BACT|nr:HAD-IIIA family hydrolase [Caminibacter pacificus]QCI28236.1 HAD-IIIA family hydrolase [Caminibacter pacificus]ROR41050.1 3-deoxy-D-manno-octulosonate 8-phosphate phosphatase (KDO 8-P phosphatase) [Caminibacter pacificus]
MIELIVIDVDGTLTDGKIYYSNEGDEIKAFNIKDGLMIKSWNTLGKKSAIITGRTSKIVERRAKELDITYVKQGVRNKAEVLKEIINELGIDFCNVAVIGDDMNDLSMMRLVSKTFAPADASAFVYDYVEYPLTKKGGEGAVAEMIEILLKEENLFNKFIALW